MWDSGYRLLRYQVYIFPGDDTTCIWNIKIILYIYAILSGHWSSNSESLDDMADNEDYFGRSSPGNQSSDQTYLYEQQAGTQRSSSAAYENTGADRALSSIDNYTVASGKQR